MVHANVVITIINFFFFSEKKKKKKKRFELDNEDCNNKRLWYKCFPGIQISFPPFFLFNPILLILLFHGCRNTWQYFHFFFFSFPFQRLSYQFQFCRRKGNYENRNSFFSTSLRINNVDLVNKFSVASSIVIIKIIRSAICQDNSERWNSSNLQLNLSL